MNAWFQDTLRQVLSLHIQANSSITLAALCCRLPPPLLGPHTPSVLALQSAILGYGLFQGLGATGLLSRHLNAAENVIVQTTAGETQGVRSNDFIGVVQFLHVVLPAAATAQLTAQLLQQ